MDLRKMVQEGSLHGKEYDLKADGDVYGADATYVTVAQDRIIYIFQEILDHRVEAILDIGFFPGVIGRLIKEYFPHVLIYGVGKFNNRDSKCDFTGYDAVYDAEFDDFYDELKMPKLPVQVDLVIVTEIIEHLVNPMHMMGYVEKSLRDKGRVVLTTPNVSSFGAIGRLLLGRSNYEALPNSVIFMQNDWRAHVRLYDKSELIYLGDKVGLGVVRHRYYVANGFYFERRKGLRWLVRWIACFVPHFREDQVLIYEKRS